MRGAGALVSGCPGPALAGAEVMQFNTPAERKRWAAICRAAVGSAVPQPVLVRLFEREAPMTEVHQTIEAYRGGSTPEELAERRLLIARVKRQQEARG